MHYGNTAARKWKLSDLYDSGGDQATFGLRLVALVLARLLLMRTDIVL